MEKVSLPETQIFQKVMSKLLPCQSKLTHQPVQLGIGEALGTQGSAALSKQCQTIDG